MKGSDFLFDYVDRLYYKSHKLTLNSRGLYISCKKWLKDNKSNYEP